MTAPSAPSSPRFLRNTWYIAAWASELATGTLLPRRLLDEPVVLWRDTSGAVHALLDRCPHRFAPLSMGRLMADGSLQCGYHGLQFDAGGRCTVNPQGDGTVPKAAQVTAYPVVERHTAVWIWMGDPARADATRIPDYSLFSRQPHEGYRTFDGMFTVQAAYELEIDNLMDLSHPEFLHAGSLGSPAQKTAHYKAWQEGDTTVHSNRWFDEGPCPAAMEVAFPTEGKPVEHWTHMRWDAPSLLWLHVGVTFTGQPREAGMNTWSAHFLTPETEGSTHYFYNHTRRFALDSAEVDEGIRAMVLHAFLQEDRPMLEAIQRDMGGRDLWSMKPVLLSGDSGGVRARRLLEKLIAGEHAAA
jgi:vanillate O-demethylase monooxygenase subunit